MAGKKGRSGRPKNPPDPKDVMRKRLPVDEVFNEDEIKMYNSLVDLYLSDFEEGELTSSDIDDILDLAVNRVMEFRLLKESKGSIQGHLTTSAAIEKIRKHTSTIKESLSTRRKDRIDPDKYDDFSIVDLIVSFDENKLKKLQERNNELDKEERSFLEKRKDYVGNKDDKDRFLVEFEDEDGR